MSGKPLNVILGLGALAWTVMVYLSGHKAGLAEGEARIAALKVERAEEARAASEAYGKALAGALERYEAEAARAGALEAALDEERERNARSAQELREKIDAAEREGKIDAGGGGPVFGPAFVRLLNEAAGAADCPLSAAGRAGGADEAAGGSPTLCRED